MKFHRNTASEIAVALFLAACSAGGEVKEPMKGDNQALVEIGTAQELEQFRDRVNEGEAALDALLTADIDLSSVCGADAGNWVPFEEYNGVFDGGGHENSGLYTEAEEGDRALFQTIGYAGIVKELESAGARIQVPGTAAALAIRNEGIVENCCSRDGQIKGHEAMGLLRGTGRRKLGLRLLCYRLCGGQRPGSRNCRLCAEHQGGKLLQFRDC